MARSEAAKAWDDRDDSLRASITMYNLKEAISTCAISTIKDEVQPKLCR